MPQTNAPKRIVVTAGEPAGIGPDLAVALSQKDWPHQVVVCADKTLISDRAQQLGIEVSLLDYDPSDHRPQQKGSLIVLHEPLTTPAIAGVLDETNGQYVLNTLEKAAKGCMKGEFDAIVTGPVHKGVINRAGVSFSGHTEFFAEVSNTPLVVMMLATEGLRTALVTTHLPLSEVPNAITEDRVTRIVDI